MKLRRTRDSTVDPPATWFGQSVSQNDLLTRIGLAVLLIVAVLAFTAGAVAAVDSVGTETGSSANSPVASHVSSTISQATHNTTNTTPIETDTTTSVETVGTTSHRASGGWPMRNGDAKNTKSTHNTSVPVRDVDIAWSETLPDGTVSAPVIDGDTLYVSWSEQTTDPNSAVIAFDAQTGTEQWRFTPESQESIPAAPAIVDNRVVAVSGEYIYGIDAETGELDWKTEIYVYNSRAISAPVIDNGTIYVKESGGTASAFDFETGTKLWQASNLGSGTASPSVTNETVYTAGACRDPEIGFSFDCVTALDATNGSQRWQHQTSMQGGESPPVIVNGTPHFISEDILAFDPTTGDTLWRNNETRGTSLRFTEELLITGHEAIDRDTNETVWEANLNNPVVADEYLISTASGVGVYFTASSDPLWTLSDGIDEQIDAPHVAVANGTIAFSTTGYGQQTIYVVEGETDRSVTPINVSLDADTHYPTPGSTVELNATNSSGTGTLTYRWFRNGTRLSEDTCDGVTCQIDVESTQTLTLEIQDAQGRTDTASVTLRPVAVDIGLKANETYLTNFTHEDTALADSTLTLGVRDREPNRSVEIRDIRVAGPARLVDPNGGDANMDGAGSVYLEDTGNVSLRVTLAVEGADGPVERRVSRVEVIRLHESLEHYEFEFSDEADRYEERVAIALLQQELPTAYQVIKQRTDTLPDTVEFQIQTPEQVRDVLDLRRGGYASQPNEIGIHTEQGLSRLESITRHELVHLAGYEMDAETDGEWNFLFEGHAVYEQYPARQGPVEKPPQEALLNWNQTSQEYTQAGVFMEAMFAEYGRETTLRLLRNSEGTDLEQEFERVTGDSFDAFYDRWLSGSADDPMNQWAGIDLKPMFYYDGEHLRVENSEVYGPFSRQIHNPDQIQWDLTGNGEYDATGDTVEWTPDDPGTYEITVAVASNESVITGTQSITVQSTGVAVTTTPDHVSVASNRTTTVDVTVTDVSGVTAHSFDLTVAGSGVAIQQVELTGQPGRETVTIGPNGHRASVDVALADITGDPATLATVTLQGTTPNTTTLTATVDSLEGADGRTYSVADAEATTEVTVVERSAPGDVTGNGHPATDPDGDGVYEDINGDGTVDIFDVQALFSNLDSTAVSGNAAFDIDGDGRVSVFDVQLLFRQI